MVLLNKYINLFIFLTLLILRVIYAETDVIELTDDNFEKLTQISTGNTTGIWFIKFYAPWCSHCKAISKIWSELATEMKNKINIAKIDVTVNSKTKKRFKIEGFPTLLFFKNGKMYDYKGHDRSLEGFKIFILENYKQYKPLDPPKPLTQFDLLKDFIFETVENTNRIYKYAFPSLLLIVIISTFFGIFIGLLISIICRSSKTKKKVTNQGKKKD